MNTKQCSICGIMFAKKTVYCGRKCYAVARTQGKYPAYWQDKTRSLETNNKISQKNKGKKPWCTGLKLSDSHRQNISKGHLGLHVGKQHPMWQGGKKIDERGYVRIWISCKQWRYEHRLVMEQYLGRKLRTNEVVHHINENRQDNRIENLMLFPNNKAHLQFHKKYNQVLL